MQCGHHYIPRLQRSEEAKRYTYTYVSRFFVQEELVDPPEQLVEGDGSHDVKCIQPARCSKGPSQTNHTGPNNKLTHHMEKQVINSNANKLFNNLLSSVYPVFAHLHINLILAESQLPFIITLSLICTLQSLRSGTAHADLLLQLHTFYLIAAWINPNNPFSPAGAAQFT